MARKDHPASGRRRRQSLDAMPEVSEQAVRELAQVFKLLSDETRLRILFYLAQNNELHVTDLCNRLGQSQPAVSHHLALLRVSGLIESRREGKHNFYSVRTDHFGELLVSLFSAAGEMPRRSGSTTSCSPTPANERAGRRATVPVRAKSRRRRSGRRAPVGRRRLAVRATRRWRIRAGSGRFALTVTTVRGRMPPEVVRPGRARSGPTGRRAIDRPRIRAAPVAPRRLRKRTFPI